MKKLFYRDLIRTAGRWMKGNWRLAWLGLFVAGGGAWLQFMAGDWSNFLPAVFQPAQASRLQDFFRAEWTGLGALGVLLFVAFVFSLINLWVRAGLLKGFQAIKNNEPYRLGGLLKIGGKKIARLLLLEILLGIPVVILAIPLFFHWGYPQSFTWSVMAIVATTLLVLYTLLIYFFRHYAYCYAVLEDQGAWAALWSGLKLLKNNFWSLILAKLLELGLRILVAIGLVVASFIIMLPFGLLGFLLMVIWGSAAIIVLIVISLVLIFLAACLVQALMNTFCQGYLTNVYWAARALAAKREKLASG